MKTALDQGDGRRALELTRELQNMLERHVDVTSWLVLLHTAAHALVLAGRADRAAVLMGAVDATGRRVGFPPEAMDPLVFFVSARGCFGQVWQYTYDEVALPSSAEDVTSHVPDLIDLAALDPDTHYPGRVRVIAPSADAQVVLFMRRDQVIGGGNVSDTIYAYSPWFTPGGDQIQRAWSELTIEGVRSIHDLTVIGDTAYMLAHCTDADSGIVAWYILAMKLTDESECDEPDAPVFTCTGAGLGGSGEEDEA